MIDDDERRINFNEDWRFQRGTDCKINNVEKVDYDDSSWRTLSKKTATLNTN